VQAGPKRYSMCAHSSKACRCREILSGISHDRFSMSAPSGCTRLLTRPDRARGAGLQQPSALGRSNSMTNLQQLAVLLFDAIVNLDPKEFDAIAGAAAPFKSDNQAAYSALTHDGYMATPFGAIERATAGALPTTSWKSATGRSKCENLRVRECSSGSKTSMGGQSKPPTRA
jgi:hypothetical protein